MSGWLAGLQRILPWLGGAVFGLMLARLFFGASQEAGDLGFVLTILWLIPAIASMPRFRKSPGEKKNV